MKAILLCNLLAAFSLCSAATVTQNYQDSDTVAASRDGRSIVCRNQDKQILAVLTIPPDSKAAVQIKDKALVVDVRNSTVTTKRNLPLSFQLPPSVSPAELSGQKVRFTVRLKADCDAEVMLMMMQKQNTWKGGSRRFKINKDTPVTLLYEAQALPGLTGFSPRIGFHTPAVYTIEEMRLETFREEKSAVSGSQLPNGGAERGWLGAYGDPLKVQSDSNRLQWFDGSWQTADRNFFLDTEEFHSGRTSFRIEAKPNAANRLYIGPVKVMPGQPLRITYWAKASKPNAGVGMFLVCNSGAAYGFPAASQNVGAEWKKISLLVPTWGRGGVGLDGNMNVHNETYLCFSPQTDATFWIDDITASTGTGEVPFVQTPFAVSGTMNDPDCNYAPGEKISAEVVISNLSKKTPYMR